MGMTMNKKQPRGIDFSVLIGADNEGNFFAHRPVEPAFLLRCNSEEEAKEEAVAVLNDYIVRFGVSDVKHFSLDDLVEHQNSSPSYVAYQARLELDKLVG